MNRSGGWPRLPAVFLSFKIAVGGGWPRLSAVFLSFGIMVVPPSFGTDLAPLLREILLSPKRWDMRKAISLPHLFQANKTETRIKTLLRHLPNREEIAPLCRRPARSLSGAPAERVVK